jgi:Fe-S cluster biogenesis protein NfuA
MFGLFKKPAPANAQPAAEFIRGSVEELTQNPNPVTISISLGEQRLHRSRSFTLTSESDQGSEQFLLGRTLFQVLNRLPDMPKIARISYMKGDQSDFVTIRSSTKALSAENRQKILDVVKTILYRFDQSKIITLDESSLAEKGWLQQSSAKELDHPLKVIIQNLIDTSIMPTVKTHGGDIQIEDITIDQNNAVSLTLGVSGGCSGCNQSTTITLEALKNMIIAAYKDPEVQARYPNSHLAEMEVQDPENAAQPSYAIPIDSNYLNDHKTSQELIEPTEENIRTILANLIIQIEENPNGSLDQTTLLSKDHANLIQYVEILSQNPNALHTDPTGQKAIEAFQNLQDQIFGVENAKVVQDVFARLFLPPKEIKQNIQIHVQETDIASAKQIQILDMIAVTPLSQKLFNALYDQRGGHLDISPFEEFSKMATERQGRMTRFDNEDFIIRESDGSLYQVLLYGSQTQDNKTPDPAHMVAIYASIQTDEAGAITEILPARMMIGSEARFIMRYQMTCCSGPSVLITANKKGEDIPSNERRFVAIIDSLQGLQKGFSQLFADKITAPNRATDLVLGHLFSHATNSCDSARHQRFEESLLAAGFAAQAFQQVHLDGGSDPHQHGDNCSHHGHEHEHEHEHEHGHGHGHLHTGLQP